MAPFRILAIISSDTGVSLNRRMLLLCVIASIVFISQFPFSPNIRQIDFPDLDATEHKEKAEMSRRSILILYGTAVSV